MGDPLYAGQPEKFPGDIEFLRGHPWIVTLRNGETSTEVAAYGLAVGMETQKILGYGFLGLAIFLIGLILVCLGVMLQFFKSDSTWVALWVVGLLVMTAGLIMMAIFAWRPLSKSGGSLPVFGTTM